MSTAVKPIPEGFHTVTPYLIVKGAAAALEFYKKAFNAQERSRMEGADGVTILHSEMMIGNSVLLLADENPDFKSPHSLNGTTVSLALYVENVDELYQQAVAAGATMVRPLQTMFYGDRAGTITDPFGYQWFISTHVEDVSDEEIKRRMEESEK